MFEQLDNAALKLVRNSLCADHLGVLIGVESSQQHRQLFHRSIARDRAPIEPNIAPVQALVERNQFQHAGQLMWQKDRFHNMYPFICIL